MAWECYRHRAAIVDFAEGELDEPTRTSVERHLAACPTCSAAVLELREVPAEVRRRVADEPSEAFWTNQREAILRAVERSAPPVAAPRPRRRTFATPIRVGSLAAAAAAALIFVRTWSSPTVATQMVKTETPAAASATEGSSTTSLEDVATDDPWSADDGSLLSLADELDEQLTDTSEDELI